MSDQPTELVWNGYTWAPPMAPAAPEEPRDESGDPASGQ